MNGGWTYRDVARNHRCTRILTDHAEKPRLEVSDGRVLGDFADGKPVERLSVRINRGATSIRSVQRGQLVPSAQGTDFVVVHLPLDITDMLLIDR